MRKIEVLNMLLKKLQEQNSGRSFKVIQEVVLLIKKGTFGLSIDDAIKVVHELVVLKPHTIDRIANYARYRTKELGAKHINYFSKVCQSIAVEPETIVAKSSKLRVWK